MVRIAASKAKGPIEDPGKPKFSSGLTPTPFTILVDTREQTPWHFTGLTAEANRTWLALLELRGLPTGDYSIRGLEDRFCIERKSLGDLYGSIGAGRERFEREHQRMAAMVEQGGYCCVIVESTFENAMLRPPSASAMSPKTLLGTSVSWALRYRVPWFFPGPCRMAEIFAFKMIAMAHKQFTEAPS